MRVADCSTGHFSEWQAADNEAQRVTAAARACQALQASRLPVGCVMGEVEGTPSLIVSYTKGAIDSDGWNAIADHIALPFCSSTKSSGIQAAVYVIEDERRAKGFNCLTGGATNWLNIRRQQHTAPSSRSRSGPATSLPHAPVYRLVQ
jgi:hypothetical protein